MATTVKKMIKAASKTVKRPAPARRKAVVMSSTKRPVSASRKAPAKRASAKSK